MNEIKKLWARKYSPQGRIDITVFFVNIFLLLCHVFLMVIYLIIGNKVMIGVNIFSLLLYILYIPSCYKNVERYMGMSFLEIWVHLICGILCFGWTPCYQNYCFGMLTAFFLPATGTQYVKSKKRVIMYSLLIIFTYFILATAYPLLHLSFTQELNIYLNSILFIGNNAAVFITIAMFAVFYTSTSNRKELELSRKADYDELTNLYNRYSINQLGNRIIAKAKENDEAYSVAILDIDHFKKVNDKYGHSSGDVVLRKVADMIKKASVNGIIPGRWGGEEFVMIAPHYVAYEEFTNVLEELRIRISEETFEVDNNKKIKLTISIGSSKVRGYDNTEKAISMADTNLYKAKETGRNKLVK